VLRRQKSPANHQFITLIAKSNLVAPSVCHSVGIVTCREVQVLTEVDIRSASGVSDEIEAMVSGADGYTVLQHEKGRQALAGIVS